MQSASEDLRRRVASGKARLVGTPAYTLTPSASNEKGGLTAAIVDDAVAMRPSIKYLRTIDATRTRDRGSRFNTINAIDDPILSEALKTSKVPAKTSAMLQRQLRGQKAEGTLETAIVGLSEQLDSQIPKLDSKIPRFRMARMAQTAQ